MNKAPVEMFDVLHKKDQDKYQSICEAEPSVSNKEIENYFDALYFLSEQNFLKEFVYIGKRFVILIFGDKMNFEKQHAEFELQIKNMVLCYSKRDIKFSVVYFHSQKAKGIFQTGPYDLLVKNLIENSSNLFSIDIISQDIFDKTANFFKGSQFTKL